MDQSWTGVNKFECIYARHTAIRQTCHSVIPFCFWEIKSGLNFISMHNGGGLIELVSYLVCGETFMIDYSSIVVLKLILKLCIIFH